MNRIIVGIRKSNGVYTVPKFSECLLEFFTKDNSAFVTYSLENGILILNKSEEGHELRHSPQCPIKLHNNSAELLEGNCKSVNIEVATSVVIESSDSHILMTKRSAHMRSSPNVWVLPGGHLDPGETVLKAAAREVEEETGLIIQTEKASILGLWENVYPLLLGIGKPKHHVLVVYLYTHLNENHKELTKKIIPDPKEVDSYCWMNSSDLSKLFSSTENFKCDGKQFVYDNGKLVEKYFDYSQLFDKWLRTQPEPYSGVSFALRQWLKLKTGKSFSKL